MSTSKIIANMINQIPSEDIQTIYPHMNTQVHQTLNSCYNKKYSEEKHTININPFDTFQQDSINEKKYIPIDILINDFLPMLYNFRKVEVGGGTLKWSYNTFVYAIDKHPQLTIKWIDLLSNQYYDLFKDLKLHKNENFEIDWVKRYPQNLLSVDRKHLNVPCDHPKVTLEWFKLYGSKFYLSSRYYDSMRMYSDISSSNSGGRDIFSNNPNVTLEWLEEYPDRNWDWDKLSNHPNLTFEWLKCFPTKPWNWELICKKKIYTNTNIEESLIDL